MSEQAHVPSSHEATAPTADQPALHVQTVCTGNICRSPIAHIMLVAALADAGLGSQVKVTSSGISAEEAGNPLDPRARKVLREAGYMDAYADMIEQHTAKQITDADTAQVDVFIPATSHHARAIQARIAQNGSDAEVHILRSFDPALKGSQCERDYDMADPWYGGMDDFRETVKQVEHALPEIIKHLKSLIKA